MSAAATHIAVDWPPAVAVLADADANGVDLIALETRGRSGLVRALLGSVADKVVRGATVPVLLQRPAAGWRDERSANPPEKSMSGQVCIDAGGRLVPTESGG